MVLAIDRDLQAGEVFEPRTPPKLFSRLLTPVSGPPMEKLGSRDSTSPVQTVPMIARMVARSTPMPYTIRKMLGCAASIIS